jgi:hypothetical protein
MTRKTGERKLVFQVVENTIRDGSVVDNVAVAAAGMPY